MGKPTFRVFATARAKKRASRYILRQVSVDIHFNLTWEVVLWRIFVACSKSSSLHEVSRGHLDGIRSYRHK